METISLPNEWVARHYQADLFEFMTDGGQNPTAKGKRAVEVWHRRSGKDSFSLNFAAVMSHQQVGTYWHMLPTLNQGRRVVWDGIDKYGRRMIDQAFPKDIRAATNNSEMKIELKCGSIWQVVGSDNYDSLVGTNPRGVIFSEYSIGDPTAWDYIRPILAENEGWAIFIFTFRGKNHGYKLYKMAEENDKWHSSLLTIEDTFLDADKAKPVITRETYEAELEAGMDLLLAQQEFYCSPDAGLQGAYYTAQLNRAQEEKRIGDWPWIENRTVTTVWDIGISDDTFIIFAQEDGEYIRIIDCMKGSGKSLGDWIRHVNRLSYVFDYHWAPHDIETRELTTGKTRLEVASSLGISFDVVPKIPLQDGIEALRGIFGRLRINEKNCGPLLDAIQSYQREYDEKNGVFKERPLHNWASHGADAARYLAVAWEGNTSIDLDKEPEMARPERIIRNPQVIRALGPNRRTFIA